MSRKDSEDINLVLTSEEEIDEKTSKHWCRLREIQGEKVWVIFKLSPDMLEVYAINKVFKERPLNITVRSLDRYNWPVDEEHYTYWCKALMKIEKIQKKNGVYKLSTIELV